MSKGIVFPTTVETLLEATIDITGPDSVEIVVRSDQSVIWINVNGVCVLRACRIGKLEYDRPTREGDKV